MHCSSLMLSRIAACLAAASLTANGVGVATDRAEGASPSTDGQAAANEQDADPISRKLIASYDELVAYTRQVAMQPAAPRAELPPTLARLDYDGYRMIAFRPERALWRNERPFWIEFFHRGFVHRDEVQVHVISDPDRSAANSESRSNLANRRVETIPFDRDFFQYRGPTSGLAVPSDAGFAGLKIVRDFPGSKGAEEMLTFLGASYFRGRSGTTGYGTSARGVAIDSASNTAEEFPVFREFWVREPAAGDTELTVLALLDGQSVAGAYEFTFEPGRNTSSLGVRCTLFFRDPTRKIGIAPLTSMWMWGDGLEGPPKDPRPSVHDADGLQILDGKEWIWRPLSRQDYPSLSQFPVQSLSGFGLLQRERRWSRYQDDEAKYHQRPSIWIEPRDAWTGGTIELFEMPAIHEGHDNIVCYWVPAKPPERLAPVELKYTIHFFDGSRPPRLESLATVQSTEIDRHSNGELEVLVSFDASGTGTQRPQPKPQVTSIRGEVLQQTVEQDETGSWLLRLRVRPNSGNDPVELSATLLHDGVQVSETWRYLAAQTPPPYKYPQVYTRRD